MPISVGEAVGYLDLDINGFLTNLRKANEEANKSSKTLSNTLGDGLQTVGNKLAGAGKVMTATITTPIVGAGTAAVKTAANFDAGMSKVSAISGATGKDLQDLRDKALEMGAKTKFSASEASDAMSYMAMAGWKTEDMLGGISGIMDLAAASGEDLATTSDIVTDALTAFGMGADESGHFADVLAAASSNANTNVSMMGESFKYVAPVAGALRYKVDDVAVALGLMANSGIKSSQAGTTLRALLTNMAKPTDEMKQAMDELGVSLEDGKGNMLTFREVMDNLRKGFGELKIPQEELEQKLNDLNTQFENGEITEEDYNDGVLRLTERAYGAEGAMKAQSAAMLAGQRGMSGLLAIVGTSDEDFNKLTSAIDNSEGAAHKMAETMQDNLLGRITKLKSAIDVLSVQIGEIIIPYVEKFVAKIQQLVDWFANLSDEQQKNIVKWAVIVAAIGPVLLFFGKLIVGIGSLIKAFGEIKTAITGIKAGFGILKGAIAATNLPILAIVGTIAILIAAFATLWKNNEEFREKIISIWNNIKESVGNFVSQISERLAAIGITFESVTGAISTIWNGFCNLLAPVFIGAFELIQEKLQFIFDAIVGILDFFIGIFTGNWEQALNGIKEFWSAAWEWIKNILMTLLEAIKGVIGTFLSWFGLSLDDGLKAAKELFFNTFDKVKEIVGGAFSFIKEKVSDGIGNAKDTLDRVLGSIGDKFHEIWEGAKSTVSDAIEYIKGLFNFEWRLPDIPLPHFSVSGSFGWSWDGGIELPSVSVDWYKKAMGKGMVLDSATIFGFNSKTGKLLGAGEAGSEVVVGTKSLMQMIDESVANVMQGFISVLRNEFIDDILNVVRSDSKGSVNIDLLARKMVEMMRNAPIVNNVTVEMEDGNIYMDAERVGRKVAPVVSRIQAQEVKK